MTSTLPPTSTNPSFARSGAGGERPSLASSQGLTVCRSDETTSTGLVASRLRRWPLATATSKPSDALGSITHCVAPLASTALIMIDAAMARQSNEPKLRADQPRARAELRW